MIIQSSIQLEELFGLPFFRKAIWEIQNEKLGIDIGISNAKPSCLVIAEN